MHSFCHADRLCVSSAMRINKHPSKDIKIAGLSGLTMNFFLHHLDNPILPALSQHNHYTLNYARTICIGLMSAEAVQDSPQLFTMPHSKQLWEYPQYITHDYQGVNIFFFFYKTSSNIRVELSWNKISLLC